MMNRNSHVVNKNCSSTIPSRPNCPSNTNAVIQLPHVRDIGTSLVKQGTIGMNLAEPSPLRSLSFNLPTIPAFSLCIHAFHAPEMGPANQAVYIELMSTTRYHLLSFATSG